MNREWEGSNSDQYPESAPAAEAAEGLSESLFEIIWRRRWTVLLITILALVGGFVYLQRAAPQYTSTSRLYVEQRGIHPLELDGSGNVTRWSSYLYTQAELLRRTETLSAALDSPGMGHLQTFAEISNPLVALRKGLDIVVGKKDEIINVSFTCPYPEEAACIVNSVVDAYITSHNERQRDTSAEVVKILQEEKVQWDQKLDEKLHTMAQFEVNNENLVFGTDRENNMTLRALERLKSALTEAQLAVIDSRTFYETIKEMTDDPSELRRYVEAQNNKNAYFRLDSETADLQTERQRFERMRADCLNRVKPDAPAIAALDAEIARIDAQINERDSEFAADLLVVAEKSYQASRTRQGELDAHFEQQRQEAVELNNKLVEYTVLQSDYERTKSFCEILDDRIRVINVDPQVASLNVEIIEVAKPADEPSSPQKARTLALALGLGLFAGVGLGLVREWKDQRLRSTEEISALLGVPLLGAIPSMASPKQTVAIRGQKVRISPDSREAEAFRTVRTAVFFGTPKEEARTILVTSPAPGEGKSTTASNLAIAMAQAGERTLLLDADFRRPTLHTIFSLDRRTNGCSSVLVGRMDLASAIEHLDRPNLDILTCGPSVPNPAELLNSRRFAEIIAEFSKQYDRIVIDSPPLIAVTDGQILAALCDITVLVLRAERSTRRVTIQAYDSLMAVNAHLLGVVVNDVPRHNDRYGYANGYGYYHAAYRQGGNGHAKKAKPIPVQEIPGRRSRRRGKTGGKLQDGLMPELKPDRFSESQWRCNPDGIR